MAYFKNTQAYSDAGSTEKANEDEVYVSKNCAFVLDGATGLIKKKVTADGNDVAWYVKTLKGYLISLIDDDKPLCEIVKQALQNTNNDFNKFLTEANLELYPSSCLTLIRIRDNKLEYYTIGDSQLLIKFNDGSIKLFLTGNLDRLDQYAISEMVKVAKEKGIDVVDARPLINDVLIKNRKLMNTKRGYYILSSDINAVEHGIYGEINVSGIESIIGCSDGFSDIYYLFKKYTREEIFELLKNGKTLTELDEELKKLQEEDKKCNKYPRFKKRDDSSAYYIELEK